MNQSRSSAPLPLLWRFFPVAIYDRRSLLSSSFFSMAIQACLLNSRFSQLSKEFRESY
jgi:hypothetical protein